ncbi:hypothetical protein MACK_001141 [Theileria orientalis]|uniref:Uncharacterized protein n=1 Tax=Theileria orientalis TaxID=68886 RepID=A0A976QVE6_THEOR|nr:hypothetical protein MACK_001141 [Theileria orientalis]
MICDNCGEVFEDVENEITCPVCGVLQNITQTQTDFFSGYYAQSKRAGRLTQQAEDLELIGETKDDKRIKILGHKLDDKLIQQKIEGLKEKELCIIVGLQEILMNLCKILIIKYEIVHLIESHSKYLWKKYLIHYFNSVNEKGINCESEITGHESTTEGNYRETYGGEEMDSSNTEEREGYGDGKVSDVEKIGRLNRELMETEQRIRRLEREGINTIVVIILMSMNKYRYGMVCSDIYRLIIQGRIPLRSVNRLLPKEVISKLYKTFVFHGPKGKMSRSLQEDYCTNIFTNTIHPKSVNSLKAALNYYLNNILVSRNDSGNENNRCSKSDYELNVTVLCRRIINFTRLPNIVIIVVDKLIKYLECHNGTDNRNDTDNRNGTDNRKGGERGKSEDKELDGQIYGSLLGYPKNVIGCAIILITCRLLWPIFHIQPPEFASIRRRKTSTNETTDDTTTNSSSTSNSRTGNIKNSNENKRGKKRIVRVIETNPKRIYHDRKENRWRIRTDEEIYGNSGQSIQNKDSSTCSDEDFNVKKLEDIGNINRYGYVKAYLNVLYYYYKSRKGKMEENKLRDELKRELLTESDLDRFKKYMIESYKNGNFSSFLSSIISRYTTNHFLLFKLLPIFNKKSGNSNKNTEDNSNDDEDKDAEINNYLNLMGASSNNLYKHLIDYYGSSSDTASGTSTVTNKIASGTDLVNRIRDNMVGNCEIFYLITSLFNNYPNYSGFSPEKSLDFSYFLLSTKDQKRQIMNMVKEIKLVNVIQKYNNVYTDITNQILKYADMLEIDDDASEYRSKRRRKSTENTSVSTTTSTADSDGSGSCKKNTCNLYEYELEKLENSFQELGKLTEIGFTLPPKPFNLRNKSYQGLPVVYLLLLKSISNFIGVAHYRVHQCVVEVENFLINQTK